MNRILHRRKARNKTLSPAKKIHAMHGVAFHKFSLLGEKRRGNVPVGHFRCISTNLRLEQLEIRYFSVLRLLLVTDLVTNYSNRFDFNINKFPCLMQNHPSYMALKLPACLGKDRVTNQTNHLWGKRGVT